MTGTGPQPPARVSLKRMIPLLVLLAGLVAFFGLGLDRYVNFETLRDNREMLLDLVARHQILSVVAFIAVYALAVAFSIPGGALLTITGGFLFGMYLGTLYTVAGATLGATALFLAARTALGQVLAARAGPAIRRMEAGFRENAVSYMLVLRLIPLFPFWLVNLVPALLGVPLGLYVATTFIGIIPGTFVYSSIGNGLGTLLAMGETPDLGIILHPDVLTPLVGLALLSLLPVIYKKVKARRRGA